MHIFHPIARAVAGGLFLLLLLLSGCSNRTAGSWTDLLPDEAPFLIVPEENNTITDLLDAPYMPFIDDVTSSAVQVAGNIGEGVDTDIRVFAIVLYTDRSNDWQPVWIVEHQPGMVDYLKDEHQQEFAQNFYEFNEHTIERISVSDRELFIANSGNYTLFSESSLGIENSIRSLLEPEKRMQLAAENIEPGTFIANTESLPNWVTQLAQISSRPFLYNTFDGGLPIHMSLTNNEEEGNWSLNGNLTLEDNPSVLLRAIRSEPKEFLLDRYVPDNAAAFSIFQLEPRSVPPNEGEPSTETDRFISDNPDIWRGIASSLDDETAFVTFAESGAESTSEYLFMRRLRDSQELRSQLSRLADLDEVERDGNTYILRSEWLSTLLGSELNTLTDFFLHIHRDIAVLAQRRGLAENVPGDAQRRRVMFYDDDYMMVRDELQEDLSSLTYVDMRLFGTYIQPWLFPQNYFGAISSNLDLFVMSTVSESPESVDITFNSYQREVTDEPYRERWVFPVSSDDITGTPVFADITSNSREEVIFTTTSGNVYTLATDGTEVLQVSTGGDTPVGPPVVFDWYGNNENVILQAAGNKIFAWNSSGSPLPNFPLTLNEEITTPLIIEDVTRNGVAEVVVATADRNLHILDSRGNAISGWPQEVNTVITDMPAIEVFGDERTIFAVAENTIHAWEVNGNSPDGFPLFMESSIYGSPTVFDQHLLSAGRDGNLYSVGTTQLFADSLVTDSSGDSLITQKLQISSGSLNAAPRVENILLRDEGGFFREDVILLQSGNGSVFLYNTDGILRFTQSMGQPGSGSFPPQLVDINTDQRLDLVTLADFGRLYAWNILTNERLYDLPTTGMSYPKIGDLYGDGNNEIIAFTREGLRCWTILETSTESD